jgi:hypothetical protein
MEIKLKDGKSYDISSYQANSFSMIMPFKQIVEFANLMTQKNVSNAIIFDKDKTELFKFGTVELISVRADKNDNANSNVTFVFKEVPQSEIELAEERSRLEAQRNVFLMGMNIADPEEVIRLCEELEEWKKIKFPYRKGERFKHNHKPYECLIDHTSDVAKPPDKSPALYKEVTKENKPAYLEWEKGKEYNKGDKVIYQGGIYECTWDKNTREPTGLGWKKI